MKVQELMEILEELVENGMGDIDVLLAQQPNYPFEYSVGRVEAVEDENTGDAKALYIGEGN